MDKRVIVATGIVVLAATGWGLYHYEKGRALGPIKVGVLHSLTGTMAISEQSVCDATLMAIEEINQEGGLLGRRIEPMVVDGKSDGPTFAREAERLITTDRVSVVFGCWTSACRKMVKPVFEQHDHLLFYPVQYEGLEQSPNIIYTGAAPNQQIIPAVKWCFDNLGTTFFLVASDYVFPRSANAIITAQVAALRGQVVGEDYLLLGSKDVKSTVEEIVRTKPAVILNTINGDTNIAFFRELRAAGITPAMIPTMSFSIAEDELRIMDPETMVGDYAAWNYFQSIDSAENSEFVRRFRDKYGSERVTDDPIEAGYFGVYLWAQAVRDAGTDDVKEVRKALPDQSFNAPEGLVSVDADNNHTWKTVRIGKIRADGGFDIVWTSDEPVRPVPYPVYKAKSEWDEFLVALFNGWGQSWANPGKRVGSGE